MLSVQDAWGRERDQARGHHVIGELYQDSSWIVHQMDHGQAYQQGPHTAGQQRARHGEKERAGEEQVEASERRAPTVNLPWPQKPFVKRFGTLLRAEQRDARS